MYSLPDMTRQVLLLLPDGSSCSRLFQLNSIAFVSIVSQRGAGKYQPARGEEMSKRKLHDDDIYVAPYTRKTGKYRHVSGHYRQRSGQKSTSYSPSSYQHEPQGGSAVIIVGILFAVLLVILVTLVKPAWLFALFRFLLYLLIAVVLGCVVAFAAFRLWENKFKYGKDGFDRKGYNREGYDREGFNRCGYNACGYNRQGYDKDGYNQEGYNCLGYDRQGYNKDGYDKRGYDREGYDRDGYDSRGRDRRGYTRFENEDF